MTAASRPAAGLMLAAVLLLCSFAYAAPARASACRGADNRAGGPTSRSAALRWCSISARTVSP
jgi:hypothetical protein